MRDIKKQFAVFELIVQTGFRYEHYYL